MAFNTIGWFGPSCPRLPSLFEINEGMAMYDYNTSTQLDEFPLDIAMQIFWSAQTITADLSVDYTISEVNYSESRQVVVGWGEVDFSIGSPLERPPVETAASMLCKIQSPTGIHTFKETINSGGGEGNIRAFFGINRRPTLALNKLHAPFSAEIAFSGSSFAAISTSNAQGDTIIGTCQWVTPWGNVQTPMRKSGNATGGSMTITVTEANLDLRYIGI